MNARRVPSQPLLPIRTELFETVPSLFWKISMKRYRQFHSVFSRSGGSRVILFKCVQFVLFFETIVESEDGIEEHANHKRIFTVITFIIRIFETYRLGYCFPKRLFPPGLIFFILRVLSNAGVHARFLLAPSADLPHHNETSKIRILFELRPSFLPLLCQV